MLERNFLPHDAYAAHKVCNNAVWCIYFDDPWIFWLPVLYLYFVPFIGFQIKYDDDDDVLRPDVGHQRVLYHSGWSSWFSAQILLSTSTLCHKANRSSPKRTVSYFRPENCHERRTLPIFPDYSPHRVRCWHQFTTLQRSPLFTTRRQEASRVHRRQLSLSSKAPSTPATMSKQRSTLSKQHLTLLPHSATMSNEISSFRQSRKKLNMFNLFVQFVSTLSKGRNFVRTLLPKPATVLPKTATMSKQYSRHCRKDRSLCSDRQCCFDIVASMDGALESVSRSTTKTLNDSCNENKFARWQEPPPT